MRPGPTTPTDGVTLHLLDDVRATRGPARLALAESGVRVAAFVALHGGTVDRRHAAGSLWPSCGDDRAAANLRSVLWRLAQGSDPLLVVTAQHVALAPHVTVDIDALDRWAADAAPLPDPLPTELMPGNTEPWVVVHRERIRQRVLHALEQRSARALAAGRGAEALALAGRAVRLDPVRESAVRALVACHLAQGDRGAAHAVYRRFCGRLDRALAARPGPRLTRLVRASRPGWPHDGVDARVVAARGDRPAYERA